MQNLFQLEGKNSIASIILDILLVFAAGSTLLFFANVIKNENKNLMLYVGFVVILSTVFNMMHIHRFTSDEKKKKVAYNAIMYTNVFVIILMVVLTYISQYTIY